MDLPICDSMDSWRRKGDLPKILWWLRCCKGGTWYHQIQL